MKLKIWCDSGANAYSCYEVETSTEDLGFTDEEWASATEDQKDDAAKEVAWGRLDWGWQELPD